MLFLTCRSIDDVPLVEKRLLDASSRGTGYVMVLTDEDIIKMLMLKAKLEDQALQDFLHEKYRALLK